MIKQVGGDHYAAEYQHWDWAGETQLGYLESAATKYVSRWRKKGGVQSAVMRSPPKALGLCIVVPTVNRKGGDQRRKVGSLGSGLLSSSLRRRGELSFPSPRKTSRPQPTAAIWTWSLCMAARS